MRFKIHRKLFKLILYLVIIDANMSCKHLDMFSIVPLLLQTPSVPERQSDPVRAGRRCCSDGEALSPKPLSSDRKGGYGASSGSTSSASCPFRSTSPEFSSWLPFTWLLSFFLRSSVTKIYNCTLIIKLLQQCFPNKSNIQCNVGYNVEIRF